MRKEKEDKQKKRTGDVVLLEDLVPRKEIKGGAGKIIFGTGADPFLKGDEEKKPKKR
jgi:hypothetical protein